MRVPWIIKTLLCKHEYVYSRTIFGDEINHRNGKRTEKICLKCWRLKYV